MAVIHVILKEIHGSLDQLTIKWEDGVGGRLKPFRKPAGMLQGLDIPNPNCPHYSVGSSISGLS